MLLLGGVVLGLFLLNRCCQFLLSPNRTAIKAVEECVGPPVTSDSTGRLTVGMRIADVPDAIGYGGDYGLEAMSDLPTRGGGRFTAAWRNGRPLALLLHEGRVTEVREGRWGAREGFMEAGYTDGYSNWQSSVRGECRHGGGTAAARPPCRAVADHPRCVARFVACSSAELGRRYSGSSANNSPRLTGATRRPAASKLAAVGVRRSSDARMTLASSRASARATPGPLTAFGPVATHSASVRMVSGLVAAITPSVRA